MVSIEEYITAEAADHGDFSNSGEIEFTASSGNEGQVTLEIEDDDIVELLEQAIVSISFETEADAAAKNNLLGERRKAVLNIHDDDTPSMYTLFSCYWVLICLLCLDVFFPQIFI